MKKIICIINLMVISLYCIAQADSRLQAVEDLSGNGTKDKINLRYESSTFYLKINSDSVDLECSSMHTIFDDRNKKNVFLFLDLNNDGHKEIAVCTQSPIFANRTLLKVFHYQKGSIKPILFYYGIADSDYFNGLVSVEEVNIIDSTNKAIYVLDSKIPYLGKNGSTVWYYGVSCYKWDKEIGKEVLAGQKFYTEYHEKDINKLIWYK